MGQIVNSFLNIFRFHKMKVLLFVVLVFVFSIWLFPYNDVGDVATAKIYELSGQQVFLKFSNMNFSVVPRIGFEFTDVSVETPLFPTLKADSVSMAPSIAGLLSFKPGVSVAADGLFNGSLSMSTRGDTVTKQNVRKQSVNLDVQDMDLNALTKFLSSPVDLAGRLNLDSSTVIDPSFFEQPEGEFTVAIADAKLLPSNIATPIGPFAIPNLNFQSVSAKGELKNGNIRFDNVKVGSDKDELHGTIKGQMDIRLQPMGGQLRAMPGAYDLAIELEVQSSLEQRLGSLWGLMEGFIDPYKRAAQPGKKSYAFRISGTSFMTPPKITAYQ